MVQKGNIALNILCFGQSLLHEHIPSDFVIQGKHGIQYGETSFESVIYQKECNIY